MTLLLLLRGLPLRNEHRGGKAIRCQAISDIAQELSLEVGWTIDDNKRNRSRLSHLVGRSASGKLSLVVESLGRRVQYELGSRSFCCRYRTSWSKHCCMEEMGRMKGVLARLGKDLRWERQAEVRSNLYLFAVSLIRLMTVAPPTDPLIRAAKPPPVVETPRTVILPPRIATLYPIIGVLAPFSLGIIMTIAGIGMVQGLQTSGFDSISGLGVILLAVILLALGVLFLGVSFAGSRHLSIYLPEEWTALALYVAVVFLAGAFLAFIGTSNFVFDSRGSDWSFAAVAVFGLLLVIASLLLYRRGFKQDVEKEKGV